MNNDWKVFLESNGAEFVDTQSYDFGNDERERRAALGGGTMCYLPQYKLLAIQGADAKSFLQGQLTSDLDLLTPQLSQLCGFCTPKGRLISNFRLFQHGDTVFAIIPTGVFETTLTQLQHFVVRSNVQMGDATEALIHIGAQGEKITSELIEHVGKLPEQVHGVLQHENYIIIKISEHRYEIFCNLQDAKTLWQYLDVQCTAVGNANWEMRNIRDGIPEITASTTEAFVPQMVNMDIIEAISFTKGCYTGQEIVARTHYLGKQKRRMYRIHIVCDHTPKAGDELATETSTANQYTGTLVNVQADAINGYEALAVIQIKSAENETLKLKNADSEITVLDLPYSLDKE